MAIPTVITDLSATLASNSPAGGDAAFPNVDDYLRAAYGFIRQGDTKASDVASASSTDLGAAVGRIVDVTGTTTITSFGTVAAGIWRIVRFTGALTLTHHATSLILPGAANIVTVAGDCLVAVSLGSGNWVVPFYQRADLTPSPTVASAYRDTAQTSGAYVIFASEVIDTASAYNTSTGEFTAPKAGTYLVTADMTVVNAAGTSQQSQFAIYKNGALQGASQTHDVPSATTANISLSGAVVCAASDVLQIGHSTSLSAAIVYVARASWTVMRVA